LIGNHIFGCDICQEVCPYNTKPEPAAEIRYQARAGLFAPQLIPLLSLDEGEFRRRFQGSPVLRAKRRGFLRNVAVALGNCKAPEAVPALARALEDDENLVRGHAAWALGQIGSPAAVSALLARERIEDDPEVREEIAEALRAVSGPGERASAD
jgi:epoxyqueuosine reductase